MGADVSSQDTPKFLGFFAETRLILGYAGTVWRMIPWRQKLTFLVAAVLMAAVSAAWFGWSLVVVIAMSSWRGGGRVAGRPGRSRPARWMDEGWRP